MNDRVKRDHESDADGGNIAVALLQWRVARLESEQAQREAEHKEKSEKLEAWIKDISDKHDANERKYDSLINKGLGAGLILTFLGTLAGYLLSFFKPKLGIG